MATLGGCVTAPFPSPPLLTEASSEPMIIQPQPIAVPPPQPQAIPPPPAAARACAAASLAAFPTDWPLPTATINLPLRVFTGSPLQSGSVLDLARRIEGMLAAAGYPRPRYLGLGCDGLAIAANFEAIRRDGSRIPGAGGFPASSDETAGSEGAIDFLIGLFYARPGFHRRIIFLISNEPTRSSGIEVSEAGLMQLVETGAQRVPAAFRERSLNEGYRVQALIYEFQLRQGSRQAEHIKPAGAPPRGLLDACAHLKSAGLIRDCRQ
jgi:hypothetical protein